MRLEGPCLGQPANPIANKVQVRLRCPLPFLAPTISVGRPWRELSRQWSGNRLILELGRTQESTSPIGLHWNDSSHFIPVLESRPLKRQIRIVQCCDLLKPRIPGTAPLLDRFMEEMAILKPDVLLLTGDIDNIGTQAWHDRIQSCLWRLEAQGTRCITTPGNHDRANWGLYLRNFGPELNTRLMAYGVPIFSLDSAHGRDRLTPYQLRFLEDNLSQPQALIQIHHPIFSPKKVRPAGGGSSGGTLKGLQKEFVELCRERQVAMVFSGHWHADAVFDANGQLRDDRADFQGPKFVTTTALASEHRRVTRWPQRYWGYRVIELEDGQIKTYTYLNQPMASHPLGHLRGEVMQ